MYRLYYAPGLASIAPHFLLNEIGAPHELVLVDRSKGEHRTPHYLALNPNARLPTFEDDGFVLYEAAAICLHLADRHPEAELMPPLGSRARAEAYKWLMFLTNTLQQDFWQFYRPEFYVPEADRPAYRATMEARIQGHLAILDTALAERTYLLGDTLSVPDFYLFMLGRWGRALTTPTRARPGIARLMDTLLARPSVGTTLAAEGLTGPHY